MNLVKTDLQKKKLQTCKQDDVWVWYTTIHLQYSRTNNGTLRKNIDMHQLIKSTIFIKKENKKKHNPQEQIYAYLLFIILKVFYWPLYQTSGVFGARGGTLNVEVIGMLVGIFLENPKKCPDFDLKPLKIPKLQFWGLFWGKMASIFQKFS